MVQSSPSLNSLQPSDGRKTERAVAETVAPDRTAGHPGARLSASLIQLYAQFLHFPRGSRAATPERGANDREGFHRGPGCQRASNGVIPPVPQSLRMTIDGVWNVIPMPLGIEIGS